MSRRETDLITAPPLGGELSIPSYSRARKVDHRREARQFVINHWEEWHAREGSFHRTKRAALSVYCRLYNEHRLGLPREIYARIRSVSIATLQRWRKDLREAPPNGENRLPERVDPGTILMPFRSGLTERQRRFVLAHYLHQGKPGIHTVYELLTLHRYAGGPEISYMTLYRFIKNIERYNSGLVTLARDGRKAFKDTVRGYLVRDWNLLNPDDLWVADGHKLDIEVRTPDGRKISRPTAVIFMDMRSRYLTGISLHWTENTYCVLQALAFGLVFNGSPRYVLFDNGSSFKNHALLGEEFDVVKVNGILDRLDITPIYAIPGEPQSKPVERLFGTLKNQFSRFWTSFTGGAPQWRPEQNGSLGVDDYPDIYEVYAGLIRWMQVYNTRHAHGGLNGKTPVEVYQTGAHRRREAKELKPLMRPAYIRTIRRNGVRIKISGIPVDYYNREWAHFFTGNGQRYIIYINDYDLSSVDIHEPDGTYLFTAYAREKVHPLGSRDGDQRDAVARLMAENRHALKAARLQLDTVSRYEAPSYRALLESVPAPDLAEKTAHNWTIDEDRDGVYLEDEHGEEADQDAVNLLFQRKRSSHE